MSASSNVVHWVFAAAAVADGDDIEAKLKAAQAMMKGKSTQFDFKSREGKISALNKSALLFNCKNILLTLDLFSIKK